MKTLWKCIKCFPSTQHRANFKTQQSPVILDLWQLRKTLKTLCFRKVPFSKMFSIYTKLTTQNRGFQIPPVWFSKSSVFVQPRSQGPSKREDPGNEVAFSWRMWTVDVTVNINSRCVFKFFCRSLDAALKQHAEYLSVIRKLRNRKKEDFN